MLIRGRKRHHNASRCIGIAHGINSCAAIHLVGSSAADDHVIASTTVDDIVACITRECVIECRAGEIFNREKSVAFSVTALARACQQAHSHRSCGCGIIRRVHAVTTNQFVGTSVDGQAVAYGVRPTDITVSATGAGIPAKVIVVEPTGAETELWLEVGSSRVVVVMHGRTAARPDDVIHLEIDASKAHLFDEATGSRLR